MNNRNMWTPNHQQALETYVMCCTATTSAQTRNYLFNHILYPPLANLCQTALKSFRNPKYINDDNQQELLIYLYTHLLNRLDPLKQNNGLKSALSFLYLGLKRNVINIIKKSEQQRINKIELDNVCNVEQEDNYNLIDNNYCADMNFRKLEIRQDIINALDKKINCEKIVNKSIVFLILLRQYLIENNFDERGFKQYVMNKMLMDLQTYRAIASKCKISTLILNKELIK